MGRGGGKNNIFQKITILIPLLQTYIIYKKNNFL